MDLLIRNAGQRNRNQLRFTRLKKVFLYCFVITATVYVVFLAFWFLPQFGSAQRGNVLPHKVDEDIFRTEPVIIPGPIIPPGTHRPEEIVVVDSTDIKNDIVLNKDEEKKDKTDFPELPTQDAHTTGDYELEQHEKKEKKNVFETAPWEFSIHEGLQKCEKGETPLNVLIALGYFHQTVQNAKKLGKTMGELRYWRDLFTGISLSCMNVTFALHQDTDRFRKEIRPEEIDIVLTEQFSRGHLPQEWEKDETLRCKLRMIDVWGTPKKQNHINLHMKQYIVPFEFQTGQPGEAWQNEYIGMVLQDPETNLQKKNQGLLWGKNKEYYVGKHELIQKISEIVPLISTAKPDVEFPDANVKNLGVVPQEQRNQLLRESKFILGMGNPILGLTPFEALVHGCVVLLPIFDTPITEWNNPTINHTSQHVEAEKIGIPYVYNIRLQDHDEILEIVEKIVKDEFLNDGYRQENYSLPKFLKRLRNNFKKDFCKKKKKKKKKEKKSEVDDNNNNVIHSKNEIV